MLNSQPTNSQIRWESQLQNRRMIVAHCQLCISSLLQEILYICHLLLTAANSAISTSAHFAISTALPSFIWGPVQHKSFKVWFHFLWYSLVILPTFSVAYFWQIYWICGGDKIIISRSARVHFESSWLTYSDDCCCSFGKSQVRKMKKTQPSTMGGVSLNIRRSFVQSFSSGHCHFRCSESSTFLLD